LHNGGDYGIPSVEETKEIWNIGIMDDWKKSIESLTKSWTAKLFFNSRGKRVVNFDPHCPMILL
jgi:hypothetical protein